MKGVLIALGVGAVAFITRKMVKKGTIKSDHSIPKKENIEESLSKEWIPAEISFTDNLNKFKPLLRGVYRNVIANKEDWTFLIVSINNDELTSMWRAAINRPDLWVTYLQTFGLQIDLLDSFEALEEYKEMYDTEDGTPLQIGKTYKVVSNCWIYTDENNQKSVALKGIVSLKD